MHNLGEFAVQTCFQGRFGEEIGTDQYGAQIMIHAERPNEQLAKGRIENIEMTYAGQAFRLGRYAIHFHLNGDMDGNYVRGCAIHHRYIYRIFTVSNDNQAVLEIRYIICVSPIRSPWLFGISTTLPLK